MNKAFVTNTLGLVLIAIGYLIEGPAKTHVLAAGWFSFSGAITNWLAVHMLFEKVPGLYGSGIIPLKFESFKSAIRDMIMSQFFTVGNIEKFLDMEANKPLNLDPLIDELDHNPVFDGFLEAIQQSKIGGMLNMFGGAKMVEPLREPFGQTLKEKLKVIVSGPEIKEYMIGSVHRGHEDWQSKIEAMVQGRLEEMTPQMVKEIVQNMIRSHLGWLVVWGGVFGAAIGLITSFLPR